jgi:hypothetical protein
VRLTAATFKARRGALRYEAHRARAFRLARVGECDAALASLIGGWVDDWPDPPTYATDVAHVRMLAGDYAEALDALRIAVHGAQRLEARVPMIVGTCVRGSPVLWQRALRLVLEGGSLRDRARVAVAVAVARARA